MTQQALAANNAPATEAQEVDDGPEIIIDDAPAEAGQQTDKPKEKNRPGYDQVDFDTASREEIKTRFNRVFGQVKAQDRKLSQYERDMEAMANHVAQLNEAIATLGSHAATTQIANAEAEVMAQLREAQSRGDDNAQALYMKKLVDINVQKALQEQRLTGLKQQRAQAQQQMQPAASAAEIANRAYKGGEIAAEERDYISAWQEETDERGQPVRPWAFAEHPRYQEALSYAQHVFQDPYFVNKSVEERMAEVERRMGGGQPARSRTPQRSALSGNGAPANPRQQIRLTDDQRRIALRLQTAGPGKSEAEHLKAYAKQLAVIENAKRGRA